MIKLAPAAGIDLSAAETPAEKLKIVQGLMADGDGNAAKIYSQDLKTGYIVGASPYKQQISEVIGTLASDLAIAGILYLLNAAWGYGGKMLPAPQANLMKLVIEGVMNANLPWTLVFVGVFFAVILEIIRIPVLPVAIGLYLPIHLSGTRAFSSKPRACSSMFSPTIRFRIE